MAKIVAFMSRKGGVGKTTTTFEFANYLASLGKTVLLVDLDPQSNLSQMAMGQEGFSKHSGWKHIGEIQVRGMLPIHKNPAEKGRGANICDFYSRRDFRINPEKIVIGNLSPCVSNKIDLIPGSVQYGDFLQASQGQSGFEPDGLLEALNKLSPHYDFILMDTPPTDSYAGSEALKIADHIVFVVSYDTQAVVGLYLLHGTIEYINRPDENRERKKKGDLPKSAVFINPCKEKSRANRIIKNATTELQTFCKKRGYYFPTARLPYSSLLGQGVSVFSPHARSVKNKVQMMKEVRAAFAELLLTLEHGR